MPTHTSWLPSDSSHHEICSLSRPRRLTMLMQQQFNHLNHLKTMRFNNHYTSSRQNKELESPQATRSSRTDQWVTLTVVVSVARGRLLSSQSLSIFALPAHKYIYSYYQSSWKRLPLLDLAVAPGPSPGELILEEICLLPTMCYS